MDKKAPPLKEGFGVVVCMIGGTPRPWEGRIRGLRNSCGSAADMACGSLPCLRATNNKKAGFSMDKKSPSSQGGVWCGCLYDWRHAAALRRPF